MEIIPGTLENSRIPAARERIESFEKLRRTLRDHLEKAQGYQETAANKRRRRIEFGEGENVLLSTKNLALLRPCKKLTEKYIGPFKVAERIGKVAYELRLPATMRLHPVFHVSLLEKYHHSPRNEVANPADYELLDSEIQWEIESIMESRIRYKKPQYLVKWKGWPSEYNEWLLESDLDNAKALLREFRKKQRT